MSNLRQSASIESLRAPDETAVHSPLSVASAASTNYISPPQNESPLPAVPQPFNAWDSSPQSPSEKPKPFRSKSKHNLAVFGAKISSTAASVGVHAAKYKQNSLKEAAKESPRESVFVDTPDYESAPNSPPSQNGSSGAASDRGGSILKNKMFKQSKTDLKSLRIKTDLGMPTRPNFNDRSPMVRGESTKELDRIAAIGQPNSPVIPDAAHPNFPLHHHHYHHHHHHHISFRKRDSPAAVLSSSASNSTLASEGTVYSFSQSSGNSQSAVASLHSFKTVEEATTFLASSWSLLGLRIQSVFSRNEALRIPVEDVNILVLMHFSAHHALGGTGGEMLSRVDGLLRQGLKSSSVVPRGPSLDALAASWQDFHSKTLIYAEAVFLPLQLEFDARGQVFATQQAAKEYWYPLAGTRPLANRVNPSPGSARKAVKRLSIRQRVLAAYRDVALVPVLGKVADSLMDADLEHPSTVQALQCVATISRLENEAAVQAPLDRIMENLSKRRS